MGLGNWPGDAGLARLGDELRAKLEETGEWAAVAELAEIMLAATHAGEPPSPLVRLTMSTIPRYVRAIGSAGEWAVIPIDNEYGWLDGGQFNVTHIPTGYRIGEFADDEDALAVAQGLAELDGMPTGITDPEAFFHAVEERGLLGRVKELVQR